MTWYANSPIISVLLATGIAWIAPQFLVAFAGYSIAMFLFVIVVRAFTASFFWTSEVGLFAISLALGYLAIIVSSVIRGFVYHIIFRAQKINGRTQKEHAHPHEHSYEGTYLHYLKMMTSTHGWLIPGFTRFFYNTFAVIASLLWGALIVGVAWFFFYYEFMVGVWPWCFMHIGLTLLGALVIWGVEYMLTERRRGINTVDSYSRICALLAIVLQFPLATGFYMMFYMIFHPMAWFGDNESIIVLMGMAAYILVNIAIVWLVSAWFSHSGHGKSHKYSGVSVEEPNPEFGLTEPEMMDE